MKGAHIVISTGDCQCKSGQTQKELFAKNIDNVRNAAIFLSEFNPAAIFCIAKPPVEALVPMVTEVCVYRFIFILYILFQIQIYRNIKKLKRMIREKLLE